MAAGVGIAPTLSGLQPVAHLSKPSGGMVLPRGDAPRSAGYRPAALLLSYRRMNEIGGAPGNRTLDVDLRRSGFRDRVLVETTHPKACPRLDGGTGWLATLLAWLVFTNSIRRSRLASQPVALADSNGHSFG